MKIGNNKGFTLVELLVTIAIIGVMMGAVIVAINPAKRLADARDADGKTKVAAVASAMEACYTVKLGSYVNCDTTANLVTDYLKLMPSGVTFFPMAGTPPVAACTATTCCISYNLENGGYWVYESAYGKAQERSAATTCP